MSENIYGLFNENNPDDTAILEALSALEDSTEDSNGTESIDADTCLEGLEDDTYVLLAALEEESTSDDFSDILQNSALEMAMYGVIDNEDIALEAQKNIVRLNKKANFTKVEKRTAIRLAAKANHPAYKMYRKGRDMMLASRDTIFRVFGSKATMETRKSLANSKKRASAMKSTAGKTIAAKIDRSLEKVNKNARTGSAIKDNDKN